MRVQDFIKKYEQNERIDIAKTIETNPYIGIMNKRKIAELVLSNCMYEVDGEIRVDSVERYILFTIAVISAHTNLEFEYEDGLVIEDYDALCRSGLLIKVIATFEDDYASCQEILNMMTADKLQESMTIEKKLYQFLDGIKYSLDSVLNDFVELLNLDSLKDLNLDKDALLRLSSLFNEE